MQQLTNRKSAINDAKQELGIREDAWPNKAMQADARKDARG